MSLFMDAKLKANGNWWQYALYTFAITTKTVPKTYTFIWKQIVCTCSNFHALLWSTWRMVLIENKYHFVNFLLHLISRRAISFLNLLNISNQNFPLMRIPLVIKSGSVNYKCDRISFERSEGKKREIKIKNEQPLE